MPTSWRIETGTYEGRDVAIDATRALTRTSIGAPFWRLVPASGRRLQHVLGWREADLPLRIAFNRDRSRDRIAAQDSAEFWAIARQMQRDLGATVFAPSEMRRDGDQNSIVNVEIRDPGGAGNTFVTWNEAGDAYTGVMTFNQASTLRRGSIVTHELLHLIGFGHSESWPTISTPVDGNAARLTPEDVAYAQVALRLRWLRDRIGARPGLPIPNP